MIHEPKPLFMPLNSAPYEEFVAGTKPYECRIYGTRWNEKNCTVGRKVILSKGYGKKNRLFGIITGFQVFRGRNLNNFSQLAEIYKRDVSEEIFACIFIKLEKHNTGENK